jgi:hypothetical protein
MAMPRGGRVGLKMETEGFRIGSPIWPGCCCSWRSWSKA